VIRRSRTTVTGFKIMEEAQRIRFSGWFGPQNHRRTFFLFKTRLVLALTGGGTWCHCEAFIETKRSHEEPVTIGCLDLKLDRSAHIVVHLKYLRAC
jgi:hypothetical protein